MRRLTFKSCVGVMVVGGAFAGCAPAVDRAPAATAVEARSSLEGHGKVIALSEASIEGRSGTRSSDGAYSTSTNPFELDPKLTAIVNGLSGDNKTIVRSFFERFHAGGSEGLNVEDMDGKPPRTASEALVSGGDCTDLSAFATAIFKEKAIPGGALVVHFDKSAKGVEHMVPYVDQDGKRVIVDLQAAALGQTKMGRYKVVMELSYDQAAEMYHREYGEYYRDQGKPADALLAFKRAAELFDGDAYVHQNLGVLYQKAGDMESAASEFKRAAEIDPAYKRFVKAGTYNEEMKAGEDAYNRKDWADCVEHFTNALKSGERLKPEEKAAIQSYIDRCASSK